MPINKSALVRYLVLDRCFSDLHRKYYIQDLIEGCQMALEKLYAKKETVSRRSIFYDIEFMCSLEGYNAPVERINDGRKTYYRYSDPSFTINRQPLNEHETQQLKEAFGLLSRLSGRNEFALINDILPKIESFLEIDSSQSIISYEENKDLKNNEMVGELFNAIRDKRVLNIDYQSFSTNKSEKFEFHPHHLKQYNGRWFLFGFCPKLEEKYKVHPINFAIDRIRRIEYLHLIYLESEVDYTAYFDDIIGVTKPGGRILEKIEIKVSARRKPYLETKPIHMSQRRLKMQDGYYFTSIEVIPNFELFSLFLSFGADVEVLTPIEIRNEIAQIAKNIAKNYIN